MPPSEMEIERATWISAQPLYLLDETDPRRRWQAVVNESEPQDNEGDDRLPGAFNPPGQAGSAKAKYAWRRISREELIENVTGRDTTWRRVGLVCGAGLGKTANLEWLQAVMNREAGKRGKQIAFFLELAELQRTTNKLLNEFVDRVCENIDVARRKVRWTLRRLRRAGRITLLLDSLDQAGADPKGKTVKVLKRLLRPGNLWSPCPIWISGRPYAFQQAHELFKRSVRTWQFLRVGQLLEAETRFLLGKVEEIEGGHSPS